MSRNEVKHTPAPEEIYPWVKEEQRAISRMVNSHGALIEMLYRLLPYMADLEESPANDAYDSGHIKKLVKEMLNLIAQAEGK